jgi:competence protein ComEC
MTLAALAFAAGAALLQLQPQLPALPWAAALPLLGWIGLKQPKALCVLAFASGFAWAALLAHLRMADWLDPALEGRDVEVIGFVSSLPAVAEQSVRFELEVESIADGTKLPRKLLLSWYRSPLAEDAPAGTAPGLHPGERWMLTVRLRRPHGNVNPHGFDYEAWLLERRIGATGYVRQRAENTLLGSRHGFFVWVEQAREAVRDRFLAILGPTPAAGILAALAIGDQRAISAEEWQLFNRTGVTHLMSISGLHVTLVSGLLAWLVASLWRRVPALALRLASRKAAAAAAIAGALGYALLAGFAVPAQRTFCMVAVVALALWFGRVASPVRVLALALAAVVAADPWAPLAPGLWLSFGAVALIFYVASGWSRPEPRLVQWIHVQWAITVGLAPAVLLLFGQVSIAGPLANAVAIPVISVVVTPLALLAAVLPLEFLLQGAAWLVEWLLQFLEWCASLPAALWQQHVPSAWAALLALAGVGWVLAPRGVPWRPAGLALMAPAFALAPPVPAAGEAWITTLDVGQGLAVLVRTANRALLYDAGPAFGPQADSGSRIVLPVLRAAGIARLDMMVLSHEDLDHLGGALTVLESMEVDALASSLAPVHPLHALVSSSRPCAAPFAWEWDGVRFDFLHPRSSGTTPTRRNDRSCVLRVSTAAGSMLLTGDIEAAAEASLVARAHLKADVLLVPHHGSRSSSTPQFIAAVAPRWAVIPVGYRSRFGHPHASVLERYGDANASVLRTDLDGAVHVVLGRSPIEVAAERTRRARYWRQMRRQMRRPMPPV